MAHLLILCEGDIEKRVLEPFLKPFWSVRFNTVEVQKYSGNGELKTNFKGDAERQLTQEPDSSVLCLVDLYEEPFGLYQPQSMSQFEGFTVVRDFMYRQIKSRFYNHFGAFPVVMEIETWLLADPKVQNQLGESIPYPEEVRHPGGRLEQIYRSRNSTYRKILDGIKLFGMASATRVYEDTCPHFNQLADWLRNPPLAPVSPANQKIAALVATWERERDQKYQRFLELERIAQTDEELAAAIQAETAYLDFLKTYDDLYHSG